MGGGKNRAGVRVGMKEVTKVPLNQTRRDERRGRPLDSRIPSRQLHGDHLDFRAQVPAAIDGRVPSRPGKAEHAEFGGHTWGKAK